MCQTGQFESLRSLLFLNLRSLELKWTPILGPWSPCEDARSRVARAVALSQFHDRDATERTGFWRPVRREGQISHRPAQATLFRTATARAEGVISAEAEMQRPPLGSFRWRDPADARCPLPRTRHRNLTWRFLRARPRDAPSLFPALPVQAAVPASFLALVRRSNDLAAY